MAGERTILLVDDEPDILDLAASFLRGAGYSPLSAANADIALIILQQPEIAFELLITDIIMPGTLDGVSLAAEVARLQPDLPVIYMTGFSGIADVRSRGAPPGRVLSKPWSRAQLLDAVREALAGAAAAKALRSAAGLAGLPLSAIPLSPKPLTVPPRPEPAADGGALTPSPAG